jgi:hypothetical protein
VPVTATTTNQAKGSHVTLEVTDVAGNLRTIDTMLAPPLVVGAAGGSARGKFKRVPAQDRYLRIYNDDSGLASLEVRVNGALVETIALAPGEVRTLDLGAAMRRHSNKVVLKAQGAPGASALALLSDVAAAAP